MLHTPLCVKVFSKNCKTYYELSLSNGLFKKKKNRFRDNKKNYIPDYVLEMEIPTFLVYCGS